jgi:hypothetical protein
MSDQPRLPGVRWGRGDYPRVGAADRAARIYAKSQGLSYRPSSHFESVKADPNNIAAIGLEVRAQQGAPSHVSPRLQDSYKALVAGINSQYDYMTRPKESGGMGVNVEVSESDPYPSMKEARADLTRNSRMRVLGTESSSGPGQDVHPILSAEVNDKFRAIHDVFGHLAIGRDTTRHGEEAAVQHHAQMFPPEAHQALFTELRGQNSALIYNKDFPQNKPYDLPDWATAVDPVQPAPPKRKPEGKQLSLF